MMADGSSATSYTTTTATSTTLTAIKPERSSTNTTSDQQQAGGKKENSNSDKPKSWRHVAIDANQVEDGDRAVFDSRTLEPQYFRGRGIHNLELIDIAKRTKTSSRNASTGSTCVRGHGTSVRSASTASSRSRNDEGNYFPIVVHATTDTVVLVTDAKFVASPTRRHADDLRRVQQQMEQEKEKAWSSPPTSS